MKIQDFKKQLTESLRNICQEKHWSFDNAKQRGMSFEDWCFKLSCERYPAADNDPEQSIIRGDDARIDIVFESKETEEIYIIQCKHPKIAANDPIPEEDIISFFSNYQLLKDRDYLISRKTNNPKIQELGSEFGYWIKQGFLIHFIFISSGTATDKTGALVQKYNNDNQSKNVKFEVWDINALKDEYVSIKSVEERYPDEVVFTLKENHYLLPDGDLENITFAIRGTALQQLAREHKDSLFNWNIRRFLGKKGEVNAGLTKTLEDEPKNFGSSGSRVGVFGNFRALGACM